MSKEDDTEWHRTTIRLADEHLNIVEKNGLNLSKWVRMKLEEEFG